MELQNQNCLKNTTTMNLLLLWTNMQTCTHLTITNKKQYMLMKLINKL
nr:MAG TPA: hypothetical protein [Caudoviricetes sp.]